MLICEVVFEVVDEGGDFGCCGGHGVFIWVGFWFVVLGLRRVGLGILSVFF